MVDRLGILVVLMQIGPNAYVLSARIRRSAGDRGMNRVRHYGVGDIVDLDANHLPKQIFWPEGPKIAIGPAFKSEKQALVGNTQRHTAHIFIHDAAGKNLRLVGG